MLEPISLAILGLVAITVVLLVVLVFRKHQVELPAELTVRMGLMEQLLQSLSQSSARNEAGNERTQAQLREFTALTA